MRVISTLWAKYQRYLTTHPWRTQTLTTAVMFSTSDILTQQIIEKKELHHDFRRTLRMCIMGVIIGPIQRTWFLTLERLIPPSSKIQILKKLVVDQTVYGPFIIFFFYSLSGTLSGKDVNEIKEILEEKYLRTLITGYKVWPFVQAINFTFVPVQLRANFVQGVSLCWNMYLSWMVNKPVNTSTLTYDSPGEMIPDSVDSIEQMVR